MKPRAAFATAPALVERPDWSRLPPMPAPEDAPSHHQFKRTRITTGALLEHVASGFQIQEEEEEREERDDGREEDVLALEEQTEVFLPRPVKSRRIERQELGDPDETLDCFGCEYLDDYSKKTTVPEDDIDRLRKMSRECFGRMSTAILAKHMSQFYERHIRGRINEHLQPGEAPLKPWPPAKVLEHLRYHHQDPTVKLVVLLEETEELRKELYDCVLQESNRSGQVRPNSKVINDYDKIVKLQLHVHSKDPTKMAFYAAGGRVNPEVLTQGPISSYTKKLHDYFRKQ